MGGQSGKEEGWCGWEDVRASTGGRVWVGECGRELQHTPAYVHIKHFTGIQPSSVYNRPHCNRIRHTYKHGKGTQGSVSYTTPPK